MATDRRSRTAGGRRVSEQLRRAGSLPGEGSCCGGFGRAGAEADRLKLSAYSAEGSDAFVRIEVAKAMREAFHNIDGYLPQGMTLNLLSDSFLRAVEAVVGGQAAPTPSPVLKR